jgi:rubrerythrin
MDIGSILLIFGLLVLVALYVSQPLFQHKATFVSEEEQEYSALLAERDRILNALQELDFDYTLGKIPEETYPSQRAEFLQRGAAILQQIDHVHGEKGDDIDTRLETTIESRRIEAGDADQLSQDDDELEALIANRRRSRNGRSGGFCPQCGNAVQQTDQFCPKCGNSLA